MKRILKRTLAMLLCLIMVFPMCTPAFAADSRTEQYAKKAAAAGIKKVTGEIPVVGGTVSDIIDTFLPDMLGIKGDHDKVMAKLDEIQNAIQNIGQQITDNQHALFVEFYGEKIDAFNKALTSEKNKFAQLSTRVKEIEDDYGAEQRDEKQAALATLISNSDVLNLTSDLATLTDYICGTQISHRQEEGILTLAYKLNCNDSALGCEAAMKNTNYVDTICGYIESAYATLFTIAMAKLYICESLNDPNNNSFKESDFPGYTPNEKKNIISAVFADNRTSLRAHYNRIFDETAPGSVINTYNNMIQDAWFSYIDSTDYQNSPARITYIPLNPEMAFVSPYAFGYNETVKDVPTINTKLMETAHGALTADQIVRLMEHLAKNPAFGTDADDLSYLHVLTDIGFSFGAVDASMLETDGMTKIFPMSTESQMETETGTFGVTTYTGWLEDYVIGYNLSNSVNNKDSSSSALMAKWFTTDTKEHKKGDFDYDPNIMLVYFTKSSDTTPIGAFFGKLSPATIPIICIGAAAIIAVPTVILVRRKKKAAK